MKTNNNQVERNDLRKVKLEERDRLSADDRYDKSTRICAKLFNLDRVQDARTVFVYMHFRSEVQTVEFVNLCLFLDKTVTIPYTIPDEKKLLAVRVKDLELEVEPGTYGIPEPVASLLREAVLDPRQIDAAIIPGSVFDQYGGRLGYGGGYYDRFLDPDASKAFRIGLAYEMQMVERVPVQPHDQFMDLVVTEKNIYDCRRIRHAQDSCIS